MILCTIDFWFQLSYDYPQYVLKLLKYFNLAFQNYRYIVVCRPLHAKSMCTLRRTRIAIVFVCLFALAYNTSRLLEYKTDTRDANNASRSSVSCFDLFQLLQPIR